MKTDDRQAQPEHDAAAALLADPLPPLGIPEDEATAWVADHGRGVLLKLRECRDPRVWFRVAALVQYHDGNRSSGSR